METTIYNTFEEGFVLTDTHIRQYDNKTASSYRYVLLEGLLKVSKGKGLNYVEALPKYKGMFLRLRYSGNNFFTLIVGKVNKKSVHIGCQTFRGDSAQKIIAAMKARAVKIAAAKAARKRTR
jgi:hypothetical protein